jgi:predicted double-glycine peptidase
LLRLEELEALDKPCLVTWHLNGAIMHSIVVLEVEPDKVVVGDPMMGQTEYTRAEFERKWMKDALVVE